MDFSTPEARARRLFGLLLGALVLLLGRTAYIQLVVGDEYAERARRQHFRRIAIAAPRGRILDRNGRALAASYHALSVAVDPQRFADAATAGARIAFLLGEPKAAAEFSDAIQRGRARGTRFVYLRRWLDRERVQRLREARMAGVDLREEPRRDYPHGAAGAAVLGVVGPGPDGRCRGRTGLESCFDALLRGTEGSCAVFQSGLQEQLHLFPDRAVPPQVGRDVATTLDVALQQIVEEELDTLQQRFVPKVACAVALDPRTGEILALAGRPGLDPAEFPKVSGASLKVPGVQFSYEMGSTVKPLVVAWALTRGVVRPDQVFDCGPGHKYFGGRLLHDTKPNGLLDLAGVLIKSSNIGVAQVGIALGIDEVYDYFGTLGFGRRTGIQLSGEQPGRLLPRARWTENYTLASVSMGRAFRTTPVQLAAAYAALVNGGTLYAPTLRRDGPQSAPRRVGYRPAALRFVRDAMVRVVAEGTGHRARVRGVAVGGKTGTAEKYPIGSGTYVSSFVGFAPAHDPKLLVLVLADDPKSEGAGVKPYGGVVAAPAVGRILARGLPLVPDEIDKDKSPSESGVRQDESLNHKVRVAAVHSSSVRAGKRILPANGRSPDSDGAFCRSER